MKLPLLVTIFTVWCFHSVASDCLPEWSNQCTKPADCCTNNCERGDPTWATGVCKKKPCLPESNQCEVAADCCSENCEKGDPTSEFGVCKKKPCLPEWSNQCKEPSDCCSNYCEKGNADWEYGVCKTSEFNVTHCLSKLLCELFIYKF